MRRRRDAATPGAEESAAPDPTVSDAPQAAPEAGAEPATPAPKPRRSRAARTEPTPTPEADAPAPAEETPVETSARARRRPRRDKIEETSTPEPVAEPAPEPPPAETAPARSGRSRRRGRGGQDNAETPEPTPEPETPPVAEPAADRPSSGRRRGRGGRGGGGNPASGPAPEPPAEPVSDKPARTRGLRRTRTVAAPQLMVSGPEPTPEPADEEEAEPVAEKSGRTRGLRRGRTGAAPLLAAPVEPLPPVYQPLPADILARLPETRVTVRKGVPELSVNGDVRQPVLFFVNTEMDPESLPIAQRQIRMAYDAGVRFFTVLAHLPWKARTGERRYGPLDEILDFVAQNAPDALILPRMIFSPPASWIRSHADQMVRYRTGEVGDVSIASTSFWESEAEEALRAAVEHIAQSDHAHRVFGFYLEHGEWLFEKGVGYDLSVANVEGFRRWLRARYRNSVVHLRAGWHDGGVTFENAPIPDWPPPPGFPPGTSQLLGDGEQCWADFHEYSSDVVAGVILRLGKAVKEASGGRSAVAVSYGYTLELPRAYSGHLALGTVLASPHVDILTGPISYASREPGGAAPPPAPIDSVALAGKLWIAEDDTKTYLASGTTPDAYNPHIQSIDGTRAVHARNFGAAITRGAGVSWMDLWGEGWLNDPEMWDFLGGLREIGDQLATRRRNPRTKANAEPDVAVLVDERAFFGVRNEALLEQLVAVQRDALCRSGARVGFYLLSDLARRNFPTTPKLLLFLNAFKIDPAVRQAIRDRFQDDGRTLAWVYGPGISDGPVSELADVIGMHLKLQPWGSKVGCTVLSHVRSPLTEALRGQKVGDEARLNPSLFVTDPRAQVLAEYPDGNAAIAVRRHARWQSVFLGDPCLTLPLLRGLMRLAGVPIYTSDDDVCWVGDALICLHSAPGGGTTLYLPEDATIHDLVYGETLAAGGYGARFSMPPRGTRLLFYSAAPEAVRFGAEPETAPAGLTREEVPAVVPFSFEAGAAPAEEALTEDEALFAAAMEAEMVGDKDDPGETEVEAPVAETVAETEGEGGGRRRRRRRRRGGGADAILDAIVEGAPDPDADAPTAEAAPARPLPSLEELLPDSEAPADGELPPIPEEFLPLDEVPAESPAPRRRRRRRPGGEPTAE